MTDEKCTKCDGTGKVPCEGCGGTGQSKIERSKDFITKWSSCASCHGSGVRTCSRCGGSGKK